MEGVLKVFASSQHQTREATYQLSDTGEEWRLAPLVGVWIRVHVKSIQEFNQSVLVPLWTFPLNLSITFRFLLLADRQTGMKTLPPWWRKEKPSTEDRTTCCE